MGSWEGRVDCSTVTSLAKPFRALTCAAWNATVVTAEIAQKAKWFPGVALATFKLAPGLSFHRASSRYYLPAAKAPAPRAERCEACSPAAVGKLLMHHSRGETLLVFQLPS